MSDDDIAEVFTALGAVTIRRIFSGKGVYVGGVIVAIEYDGELRLKADSVSAPELAAAGATQWTYHGRRGAVSMPYWSVPEDAYDDPDLMARWVRLAFDASLRTDAGKTAPHQARAPSALRHLNRARRRAPMTWAHQRATPRPGAPAITPQSCPRSP